TYYQLYKTLAQQIEIPNTSDSQNILDVPAEGRLIGLDPGTKRIGMAICDETRTVSRPLSIIERSSWKKLLLAVKGIISEFDAAALVIGLPLNTDGSESEMSAEARELARKFGLSLNVPVFLQDERVSTYEARGRVWRSRSSTPSEYVDSEAARVILEDFMDRIRNPNQ
ncbi:MAG: Holliday junction resolvase RuvX, partial [Acidobacteriota bacterium]